MLVEEVMSRQTRTCRVDDTLATAARLMWDHDIGAIPVLGADGKLAGIITDRDICMAGCFESRPLAAMPVGAHMSHQVFTVEPAATLEAAEELMAEKQVRRLPVVGFEGDLVGMITMADVARAFGARRKEVNARGLADAMSRIVRSRQPEVATS